MEKPFLKLIPVQTLLSVDFLYYLFKILLLFLFTIFFQRRKHRLFCIRSICFIWCLIFLECSMLNGFWVWCFILAPPWIPLNDTSFFFKLRHPVQRHGPLEAWYRWKKPTDLRGQLTWSSSRQRTWFLRNVRPISFFRCLIIFFIFFYLKRLIFVQERSS